MFRPLILLGLLASLAHGQASTQGLAGPAALGGPSRVAGAGAVATASPSWVPYTVAAWMLDEPTGTRVNAQGSASRKIAMTGTVINDTTNKMEGTASVGPFSAANRLDVTDAAFQNLTTAVTSGCWAYLNNTANQRIIVRHILSQEGFFFDYIPSVWRGVFDTPAYVIVNGATGTQGAWTHVVARVMGGTAAMFANGVSTGTGAVAAIVAGTGGPLSLGGDPTSGANPWLGRLDECFITNTAFPDTAICRICSCGLRGEQCTCSGTAFASRGRNATNCGSCTLPADCSAVVPSLLAAARSPARRPHAKRPAP
jgi:hypothetical protein